MSKSRYAFIHKNWRPETKKYDMMLGFYAVPGVQKMNTLPETNIAHGNPIFPCKYHQNGGFSWAMLGLGRVLFHVAIV